MQADRERTIALAHQIEVMARQKRLKSLKDYLRRDTPQQGALAVLAMFQRFKARQDGKA